MRTASIIPVLLVAASVAVTGCEPAEQPEASAPEASEASSPALSAIEARLEASSPEITAEDLAARIELLAHDELGGRAPSTPGGRRASQWIADEMARVGLEPMPGGWFQTVPLVESTVDTDASSFTVTGPDGATQLAYGDEVVFWTKRLDDQLSFDDSEMVFIGYGAVAPEYGWDDYAGLDAEGKTVVMLVNDPGFATRDPELFNGRAMTYYGRWTYKFEEAGRQGPDAAIIIHETEPASYGWDVVANSWTGAQYDLDRGPDADPRVTMEGWITREVADRLFAQAGLDLDELKAAAALPGFEPVPMTGLTSSGQVSVEVTTRESRNVGGVLRGSERPDEYVLYTGHWDHLGTDPNADGDGIYNGAIDNATGIAGILEIAEKLAARETPPARSVLFLAVTAEESGLLGSEYFAVNPVVPLSTIVAGINIDAVLPVGPARDLVVVGYGASELEEELRAVAEPRGKTLTPDPNPEAGYFYRSDHISLAKRGVPMLYADAGEDLVDGGVEAGAAAAAAYRAERYHGVADEFGPDWNFEGMVETFEILYQLGENLAESSEWPNWYEGNEFRSLRDEMRADG